MPFGQLMGCCGCPEVPPPNEGCCSFLQGSGFPIELTMNHISTYFSDYHSSATINGTMEYVNQSFSFADDNGFHLYSAPGYYLSPASCLLRRFYDGVEVAWVRQEFRVIIACCTEILTVGEATPSFRAFYLTNDGQYSPVSQGEPIGCEGTLDWYGGVFSPNTYGGTLYIRRVVGLIGDVIPAYRYLDPIVCSSSQLCVEAISPRLGDPDEHITGIGRYEITGKFGGDCPISVTSLNSPLWQRYLESEHRLRV